MITLADVARRAGVTPATVSHVLTERVTVSEKTRARVLQAIAELGYRPNLVARGLAQGKTATLGVLVPTISHPFFAEMVEEIASIATLDAMRIRLVHINHKKYATCKTAFCSSKLI